MSVANREKAATDVVVVPDTMRAAVYRAPNQVRVEELPVPEIGPGEVLVRIDTCGICGTDLKKIHTGSPRRASSVTRWQERSRRPVRVSVASMLATA